MLVLRSAVFNVAFYVNLLGWLIACLPTLVLPHTYILGMAKAWARSSLWLMRILVGTRVEYRNLDRIPDGAILLASKHQSAWETFMLLTLVDQPTFILKRELTWTPMFGWYLLKCGMIAVNRQAGMSALSRMTRAAVEAVKAGRQIIIFPEGTRREPGAAPDYKTGIGHLYRQLRVPCIPLALNSGLFWPRRRFVRRPGTIVVEVLESIPPGLPRDVFLKRLEAAIETASDRLLIEAARSH